MDGDKSSSDDGKDKEIDLNYSYNDALSITGLGKFHYLLLFTCGLCLMSVIVESLNIGFVLPLIDFECDLKLTLSEKGLLSSSAFAGIVLSSYLWGVLADVLGRHKIMLWCSSCSFLFSVLSSFSTHTWMLIITRFFVGFFISGLAANTYAYLGEFHCDKNRARHLNFCGVFMAFALTFCPGLGYIILKLTHESTNFSFIIPLIGIHFSIWRIFLLICSSFSFIITLFLLHLPESPKFLLYQDRHDEALKILQNIYKINTGSTYFSILKISIDEQLVNRIQLGEKNILYLLWSQTSPLFKKPLLKHTWKLSFIMFSLFAASSGFYMWVPEILNHMLDHNGMSVCDVIDTVVGSKNNTRNVSNSCTSSINVNDTIYSITFFMGVFFSIVYFINGLIINKFGKRNLLGLWFFICGLCSILIPFNNNFYIILLLLLLFLTSGCCGSIASAIIVDLFPTNIRAISLTFVLTLGRFGAIVGSLFVSFMIVTSCELMFIIFGLFLILSVLISCVIPD
ncbi:hypothetical protein PVAND_013086 [Polypedilum vanderplanki]|uniref:Major facilitator superfamily (MFS) profile domain-containing protein n=1 Tax=Polypedilum vanderplanki TaxID=319348 RepID=A0A9J6CQD8_POLVA|nr:hypothetical protein PVAND_013086 [Polypedilum vanderplanki]